MTHRELPTMIEREVLGRRLRLSLLPSSIITIVATIVASIAIIIVDL